MKRHGVERCRAACCAIQEYPSPDGLEVASTSSDRRHRRSSLHTMLTLITTGLSFQAGFRAPVSTSAARSMATMDATALKQARTGAPA
eukprot:scaffold55526_cov57-Phaeocystis_antarctica.AAC.2